MSAADIVSILRGLAVAPVVWLVATGQREAAFLVFVISALSDAADGAIARRVGPSRHGTLLDPLADKVLVVGVAAALFATGAIPAALLALLAVRELAVALVRVTDHRAGVRRPADASGKAKTAAEMGALAVLVMVRPPEPLAAGALALLWAAALFGVVALRTTWRPREGRAF